LRQGRGGDFADCSLTSVFLAKPNWSTPIYATGALQYFEALDELAHSYDALLAGASQRMARSMRIAPSATR
jgi:hypothetical protein